MCRTCSFSSTRPLLDTALAVCIVVLASHFPLSAREAVVDPRLTISVRMYTDIEPIAVDLDAARAHVEAAFRPTGIQIEWLACHRLPAPSHCQSPPATDELVVRMAMSKETARG